MTQNCDRGGKESCHGDHKFLLGQAQKYHPRSIKLRCSEHIWEPAKLQNIPSTAQNYGLGGKELCHGDHKFVP